MRFVPMHDMETPRLLLRQVRLSDLEDYHRHLTSDPEVAKYMLWEANPDISHTEAVIQKILAGYAGGSRCHWAIVRREDGQFLGTVALLGFEEETESCSFAYMLGKRFWGRGYGTEALQAAFRFAFEARQVKRITADHFADNPASGRAMEKAGMEKVRCLPGKYEKNGTFHDAVEYTLLRKEEDYSPSA